MLKEEPFVHTADVDIVEEDGQDVLGNEEVAENISSPDLEAKGQDYGRIPPRRRRRRQRRPKGKKIICRSPLGAIIHFLLQI